MTLADRLREISRQCALLGLRTRQMADDTMLLTILQPPASPAGTADGVGDGAAAECVADGTPGDGPPTAAAPSILAGGRDSPSAPGGGGSPPAGMVPAPVTTRHGSEGGTSVERAAASRERAMAKADALAALRPDPAATTSVGWSVAVRPGAESPGPAAPAAAADLTPPPSRSPVAFRFVDVDVRAGTVQGVTTDGRNVYVREGGDGAVAAAVWWLLEVVGAFEARTRRE